MSADLYADKRWWDSSLRSEWRGLVVILDSRLRGNDKGSGGNDRGGAGM